MAQMCPSCSVDNPEDVQTCSDCGSILRGLLGKDTILSERYQIESVLGCGAMGAVYLATDNRLTGRRCAIKENRPDEGLPEKLQDQAREQFLGEASVLARLDHSRLPKVSDYFLEKNREYLVMDYVEGDDLVTVLHQSKTPLDEATVLEWVDQVLDALEYLHTLEPQPIIHRDIKPANLRVNSRGRVKLVDFGLVKLLDPTSPETKVELRGLGTPAYAPLEQFADSQTHTDARSDIYSLGATMYHMLTHLPPTEVHQRLLKPESLIPPSQLNAKVSPQTERAILKAMAIHPNERYQSAHEMREALQAAAQGMPLIETEQPVATRPRRQTPVWIVALLVVLFAALMAGALYIFIFNNGNAMSPAAQPVAQIQTFATATPTTSIEVQPLSDAPTSLPVIGSETNESGENNETVEANVTNEATLATSPATNTPEPTPTSEVTPTETPSPTPQSSNSVQGSGLPAASLVGTIAYPIFNGVDFDLYFGQVDGSGTALFRKHASQPAFSPDGNRLAFHSWLNPWALVTMQLPRSEPLVIADFVEDQLPTWTVDGNEIIYLSRREGDRKSRLVKVGSTQRNSSGAVLGEGEYPSIGANGDLIFRGWGNSGTGIRLADTNLNNQRVVTRWVEDTAPALSPDGKKVAFMSQREDNWDIFVANTDGSNPIRVTTNPNEDGLPTWSPDGKIIAFVSFRNDEWGVWAMLPTGEDQRLLFEMEGSPDGYVGANRNASRGWTEERISWIIP